MLELLRDTFTSNSTIGELYGDGDFLCDTLEDPVREGLKIFGATAIPGGSYEVKMLPSHHFKRELPHILNVPGFTEIMLHIGNYPKDTHGCILTGERNHLVPDFIGHSKTTFEDLVLPFIKRALEDGVLMINIYNKGAI